MAFRGKRPPDEQSEARAAEAWELRRQGFSQAHIAAKLGVSQQAVSKLLAKLSRDFGKHFKDRVEQVKAEQTAQLEYIQEEAMSEWHRSKEDAESESVKDGKDGSETTTKTEGRIGDPRLLNVARDAMADVRKIWGADAPLKSEIQQRHSGEIKVNDAARQQAGEEMDKWRAEMKERLQHGLTPPEAPPEE